MWIQQAIMACLDTAVSIVQFPNSLGGVFENLLTKLAQNYIKFAFSAVLIYDC